MLVRTSPTPSALTLGPVSATSGPAPLLVDARTAARLLSISTRSLWSHTFNSNAPLPHVRLGRRVLYRPADLESWIGANTKPADGPNAGAPVENVQA